MKSTLRYLLVAENAFVDSATSKPSIIGLFSEIRMKAEQKEFPLNFVVVGFVTIEGASPEQTVEIRINVNGPNGLVATDNLTGNLAAGNEIQFQCFFPLVVFKDIGTYKVEVLVNGEVPSMDEAHTFFKVSRQ